jgi:hypothetical protein
LLLSKKTTLPIGYKDVTSSFWEKIKMFKAVWGFDPEEALRAQNAFRRASVPGSDVSAEEIDREPDDELRIPQTENSQVNELHRIFRL